MSMRGRLIHAIIVVVASLFLTANTACAQNARFVIEKLKVTICHDCPEAGGNFRMKCIVEVLQDTVYNSVAYNGDLNDSTFARVGKSTDKHKKFEYVVNKDILFAIPSINSGRIKIRVYVTLETGKYTTSEDLFYQYEMELKNEVWSLRNSEDRYQEGMYASVWKWTASLVCKLDLP